MTSASIITTEQAKNFIGIAVADTSHDTILAEWIDIISREFEGAIENKVNAQELTVYVNGSGEIYQNLPYYPVIALYGDTDAEKLANLQSRSTVIGGWEDLEDDLDYISIDAEHPERIELLEGETFPQGQKNIRVRYWAGYSRDNIPGDISHLILEMVADMWAQSGRGESRLGKSSTSSSTSAGNTSANYVDLRPRWTEVVNRYKRYQHNIEMYR
jgi:hypothetical protein